jgi:hypothetical protein
MRLRSLSRLLPALSLLTIPGCALAPGLDDPERLGEAESAITVQQAINSGCSTAPVKGLSQQIVDQAECFAPGSYALLPNKPNVTFNDVEFRYLQTAARDALVAAIDSKPGAALTINSMLRTLPDQYLLYAWYQAGTCGISLAATPGGSNHETGLAIDINQYSAWQAALTAHGFKWYGNADVVHYDYKGAGAVAYTGNDIRAFQQLWNKNNPGDVIAEDGIYGPQTGARLAKSPAGGFAMGPSCPPKTSGPDVWPAVSFDAKDTLADQDSMGTADLFEGDTHTATLTITNKGDSVAATVDVGVWIEEPYLIATDYLIESDWTHAGTFTENEANSDAANPPHTDAPGAAFTLKMHALSPGETKRITLTVLASAYSIGLADSPDVRFWVADIPDVYHQVDFGKPPTLSKGQTFSGGTLQTYAETDVYSHTHWEWNSARFEGWSPEGDATLTSDTTTGVLAIASDGAAPGLSASTALFPAADYTAITLRARRNGGTGAARLRFTTDDEPELSDDKVIDVDLPDDDAFHEVTIVTDSHPKWTGTITGLRLDPFENDPGSIELDYLRAVTLDGGEPGAGVGGSGPGPTSGEGGSDNGEAPGAASCSCATPGAAAPDRAIWPLWGALGAALAFCRRRSRPSPC